MHTRASLATQLRQVLPPGGIWIVHSSCRSLGPVEGGADTVVAALLDALGPDGTLMVDEMEFASPLGPLGRVADALYVEPMLRRIFAYRRVASRQRFGLA